ncbi:MAG: MlaD family protein [Candidatus Omnitrophica bacterium]|nr:MlaD family protein [Candidatus Omnitrophota bacterium]
MKMAISNEMKTEKIIVAGILVAVFFWAKTTDLSAKPYKVKTYFNYADGVKKDSIVKLSGVEVGRVENVSLVYTPETKIELVLSIDKKAKIREDAVAFISTSGMIGDAYIGIAQGSTEKEFIKEGGQMASEDPIEMRKLTKKADAIADNLDKTLAQVKSLVADNKAKVDGIAANLEATSVNFKEFSEDIKQHPWKLLMKGK